MKLCYRHATNHPEYVVTGSLLSMNSYVFQMTLNLKPKEFVAIVSPTKSFMFGGLYITTIICTCSNHLYIVQHFLGKLVHVVIDNIMHFNLMPLAAPNIQDALNDRRQLLLTCMVT